jgi:hypothetical protein
MRKEGPGEQLAARPAPTAPERPPAPEGGAVAAEVARQAPGAPTRRVAGRRGCR